MFNSHKVRLNRFLGADGKCLDVAIDHGVFNEYSFLDGLEDMPAVVRSLVDAGPDAIQMNVGQADILQSIPGAKKPALVLRTDVGNLYNATTHAVMFDQLVHWDEPIIGALKMDAACVVCNLLLMPGQPDLHRQTVLNAARLRAACDRYGMPLMIEPLVLRSNESDRRLSGRWQQEAHRPARPPGPRTRRRCHQGRSDRPRRGLS